MGGREGRKGRQIVVADNFTCLTDMALETHIAPVALWVVCNVSVQMLNIVLQMVHVRD